MLVFGGVCICEFFYMGGIPLVWMTYIPIESMYTVFIFTYIGLIFMVNVSGWHAIHGSDGIFIQMYFNDIWSTNNLIRYQQ